MLDDARLTKPSGPVDAGCPREKTLASVEPSLETEWHATQRLPAPLSCHGGLVGLPALSGVGVPSALLGPESNTGFRVPLDRSIA